MKKIPGKYLIGGLMAVLLLAAFGSTYYFYSKSKELGKMVSDTELGSIKEVQELTTKIGKLMELPKDETPQVATVKNKEDLPDQEFFANAESGDKVLFFIGAKKAILFRPSTNKIIDVAPINVGDSTQTNTQPAVPEKIELTIYNGTFTAGLAKTRADEITAQYPEWTIIARKDASKKDYTKTLVVDLIGSLKTQVEELATFLNAEVSVLPEGERKPEGSILVILGQE